MTFPVFASGDVLNASDMNAVGLWLIKTQTVGTGVSSSVVTGAFSSDYDNYRIVYSGGTMSSATALTLKLGSATSGVYGVYQFVNFGTSAYGTGIDNNSSIFTYFGGGDSNSAGGIMDLLGPNIAKPTRVVSGPIHYSSNYGTYTGIMSDFTQYTGFTIGPFSGTMTGGTIRVYGYRN